MKHIQIINWEKTQHYKNRNPPWIRLYVDITEKYDKEGKLKKFHSMDDGSKLSFLMLLCLSSKFNNNIPYENDSELASMLGINIVNLKELEKNNYINIIPDESEHASNHASAPLQKNAPDTFTDTDTDTEGSAFALPDQEMINEASEPKILELIDQIAEELYQKKIFPDAPKFKNTMKKAAKNPRAILHAFIRCYIKKPPKKEAWGYCVQILKTENGNYNERDHFKDS